MINMENNRKPSMKEIFYALAGQETRDWETRILQSANPKDLQKVKDILAKYSVPSEAEIELGNLIKDERNKDDRDF